MRLIDADALIGKIEKRYIDACIQVQKRRSGKGVQCGIALGMNRARNEISEQPTIDAVPVVRCKDCVFFRDRHVLTDDGQRKSYAEMPPEAFSLLGDGSVTAAYGINVGSQCLLDCDIGYSDDKTVFRRPDEFCSRAAKKMDKED